MNTPSLKTFKTLYGATTADIYCWDIEDEAYKQIDTIVKYNIFSDKIVVMPDCHAGKGVVIGFTGKFNNVVIPNVVGVDIGCGVYSYPLEGIKRNDINFKDLDLYIKTHIPIGLTKRTKHQLSYLNLHTKDDKILSKVYKVLLKKYGIIKGFDPILQVGTLGSGNHFIELGEGKNTGTMYITVHSGSRHLGLEVANFFQALARDYVKKNSIEIPMSLAYLPLNRGIKGFTGHDYITAMKITEDYADLNRRKMLQIIVNGYFGIKFSENKIIKSVHNYIDIGGDFIVRKGAIKAYTGDLVVIPFNLATGLIIAKVIADYNTLKNVNFSLPHGAGRSMSRKKARRTLSLSKYVELVQKKGIYSSTVNMHTLDEAPFAYKDPDKILNFIKKFVKIIDFVKPLYNLKG